MDNSMLTEKVGLLGNLILREATTFEFLFFFNVTFGVISVGCIFSKQLESSWPWYLKKKKQPTKQDALFEVSICQGKIHSIWGVGICEGGQFPN